MSGCVSECIKECVSGYVSGCIYMCVSGCVSECIKECVSGYVNGCIYMCVSGCVNRCVMIMATPPCSFMDFVQLNAGGTEQDSLVPTEMESIQYEYLYEKGERVVLGRGSFGVVYSALDKVTKKLLAVKEIPEREKDSR